MGKGKLTGGTNKKSFGTKLSVELQRIRRINKKKPLQKAKKTFRTGRGMKLKQ